MNASRYAPSVPQAFARCVSTRLNGNASWPAGTGVCVVKIVVRRTSSSAESNESPRSSRSRMRCSTTNAACPSLRCQAAGVDAHRLQRADAADAEDDLLLHARFAIAAVEPRRQLAVPRGVLLQIGVEQIQLHAAEPHAPHRDEDAAVAERHGDDARFPVGRDGRLDRRVRPREALVGLLLPAFRGDALMEIALRVHEPDADERNAEVARLLAVIAREHAEAAGVDRQRLMERELGREVRDRPLRVRVAVLPPRVARAPRVVQRLDGRVVHRQKPLVLRREVEHLLRNQPEHQHRVVRGLPPERVVELAEHFAGLRVPGPPEIGRQFGKPAQAFGDRRSGHSIQRSPFR